jgi:hypothetical protein
MHVSNVYEEPHSGSTQRLTPSQLQQVMNDHIVRSVPSPALHATTFLIRPFSAVLRVNFHPSGMDLTTPFTTVALGLDQFRVVFGL